MDEPTPTPGEQLREARRRRKLSQGGLGQLLGGTTQSLISLWETDERRPTLADALAMQGALDLDARVWGYTDEEIARVGAAFAAPAKVPDDDPRPSQVPA